METDSVQVAKENEELKTRSIRATDSVFEDFKGLIAKYKWNSQNLALSNLVNSYVLTNAQSVLTDRQAEIENFNLHIQAIISAYTNSLELAEHTEERIKARLEEADKLKDGEIRYLREQYQYHQNECKRLREANDSISDDLVEWSEKNEELQEYIKSLKESEARKDVIIESLTKINPKMEEQETVITGLRQEIKQLQEHSRQLEQAKHELNNELYNEKQEYFTKARSIFEELEASRKEVQSLKEQVINLQPYYNDWLSKNPQ